MNERNGENLKELFEQFYTSEEAEKAAQEIRSAERILRENPAPEPSVGFLEKVESKINSRLLYREHRRRFRRTAYKAAVAAAAVIVVATLWIGLEKGGGDSPLAYASIVPTAIWESDNIATDDMVLAFFTAEIEQIEGEVKAFLYGESGSSDAGVDELEMEFLEIENDFWKG